MYYIRQIGTNILFAVMQPSVNPNSATSEFDTETDAQDKCDALNASSESDRDIYEVVDGIDFKHGIGWILGQIAMPAATQHPEP